MAPTTKEKPENKSAKEETMKTEASQASGDKKDDQKQEASEGNCCGVCGG